MSEEKRSSKPLQKSHQHLLQTLEALQASSRSLSSTERRYRRAPPRVLGPYLGAERTHVLYMASSRLNSESSVRSTCPVFIMTLVPALRESKGEHSAKESVSYWRRPENNDEIRHTG